MRVARGKLLLSLLVAGCGQSRTARVGRPGTMSVLDAKKTETTSVCVPEPYGTAQERGRPPRSEIGVEWEVTADPTFGMPFRDNIQKHGRQRDAEAFSGDPI
ncbi:hypothetical protein C8R45DRAFT_938319 [Mycena sanguinolenta]|nr:hypothetical protein C8R45DRAFT_938319 [Mycena sanguinolenta]